MRRNSPTGSMFTSSIHYHLTVTNIGVPPLSGLTVDDPGAPDCEQAVGGLAAGAHQTIDCPYTPSAADLGTFANTATADSAQTAPVTSNTVSVTVTIPPNSGVVSGTVSETGSGTPIAGALVAILDPGDFSTVAFSAADNAGHYTATPPAGTYFVYALDPTGGHVAGFHGSPSTITVTVGNTTGGNVALASTRGTVAGVVDDDGGPLAGVVAMTIDLGSGQPGVGDLTDGNGAYSIPGLRPGNHLVEFVDLSGTHSPEFYDDAPTPAGSTIVAVTGAGTTTANATLAPRTAPGSGAHLVGDVTSSAGGPLEGVAVMALHTADFSLAEGVLTDATGHYDLDVDPGTYKLAFYDPTGTHRFEWHDDQGADGLASAATVTAAAGSPLTIDAALTPTTGTITGTVTETTSGDPLPNVFAVAIDSTGTVMGGNVTAADGTYTIGGLPPGTYRVRFVDNDNDHAPEYYDDSPDYNGAIPLTVTAGNTLAGIDAALA